MIGESDTIDKPPASASDGPKPVVFIVDDDEIFRNRLAKLCKEMRLEVESYGSPAGFLENYDGTRHGCLVTDVRMPGMSGIDLLMHLGLRGWHIPTIMITAYGNIRLAVQAMKQGAVNFFEKPVDDQEIIDCIHLCIEMDFQAKEYFRRKNEIIGRFSGLSSRESAVMQMLLDGLSNKDIAARLGISHKTVETHRSSLMRKMGAKSLANLLGMCMEADMHYLSDHTRQDHRFFGGFKAGSLASWTASHHVLSGKNKMLAP